MMASDDDIVWALREAAKPSGFMPQAESTVGFLTSLEMRKLLRRSEPHPVWYITDRGRAELAKLTSD